jgi:hypothetical protein
MCSENSTSDRSLAVIGLRFLALNFIPRYLKTTSKQSKKTYSVSKRLSILPGRAEKGQQMLDL